MKNTIKKFICTLLAVVLMLTAAPLAGFVGMEFPEIDFNNIFVHTVEAAVGEQLLGDVDGNKYLTPEDSRLILRCAVGLESLSAAQLFAADINKDGVIDSNDSRLVLRASVGLEKIDNFTYVGPFTHSQNPGIYNQGAVKIETDWQVNQFGAMAVYVYFTDAVDLTSFHLKMDYDSNMFDYCAKELGNDAKSVSFYCTENNFTDVCNAADDGTIHLGGHFKQMLWTAERFLANSNWDGDCIVNDEKFEVYVLYLSIADADAFKADGTTISIEGNLTFDEGTKQVSSSITNADAPTITSYNTGDIVEFGWYPQSEVTDSDTIAALNAAGGEWISYNYYSGTGSINYGNMTASDYMRYKDVLLDGNKYRGVVFDSYRPYYTGFTSSSTYQDDNGYSTNTVYWFKFDPIKWRVLDPSTGMVMSETILDSQAYNNYFLQSGTDEYGNTPFWGDSAKTHYANNYEKSNIRAWLNADFYNTAFSAAQQNIIVSTTLDNSAYSTSYSAYDAATTSDKIYLLSYSDALNTNYGFSSTTDSHSSRQAQGSAYAKCQGLYVYSANGNSCWLLRSAGYYSHCCCRVNDYGRVNHSYSASSTSDGVRPAFNFNLSSAIFQSNVADLGNSPGNGTGSDPNPGTSNQTSYFTISSAGYSVDSVSQKSVAKYSIHAADRNGEYLSVDGVTIENLTEDIASISFVKKSDTEIELTLTPIKGGEVNLKISDADNSETGYFCINVYENTVTYRADQVPVTNEKLKTNFVRGDMTVDNFSYYFDENKDKYVATMDVYNSSGAVGVVAAYTQDGRIADIEEVSPFNPLPGDIGEFFVHLGAGAVSIAKGEIWNYRYADSAKKTSIEIEVPKDGYLTVSCDVTEDSAAFLYNLISIGVDAFFKTAEIIEELGTDTDDIAKKTSKTLAGKLAKYFSKDNTATKSAMNTLVKMLKKDFTLNTLKMVSLSSLDLLAELFRNMGEDFDKIIFDVVKEIVKKEIKEFGVMATLKTLVENKVIDAAEKTWLKAASIMFDGGEYVNLANNILGAYQYNPGTGKTMIVFEPKGVNGFICKDTVKVISDVITDEVLLHTYVLGYGTEHAKFVRGVVHPYYNRDDGLDEREMSIDLNRILEVHEISLLKNGKEIDTAFTATVEIEVPGYMNKKTCNVYRVEKDGSYTKLDTTIKGNKVTFETDHFSLYVLTGIRNDMEGITPCDGHVYEITTEAPTCTASGATIYTCYCGDTYTEEVAALGHTEEVIPGAAATCTTSGLTEGKKCTVCGEVTIEQTVVSSLGHTEEVIPGTAATCTATGLTEGKKCTVCGETTLAQTEIAKLAHSKVTVNQKAATATEDGYTGDVVCSVCSTEISKGKVIPATGDAVKNCDHLCHKDGFVGFIWKIVQFFWKLFKMNPVCECGKAHY